MQTGTGVSAAVDADGAAAARPVALGLDIGRELLPQVEAVASLPVERYGSGRRLSTLGNGGSSP